MEINGELFYNMVTHEVVKFSPREVGMVFVQDCEIHTVDTTDMSIVETEYVYVAMAMMLDGRIYGTEPFTNRHYAHMIATTLAGYCEDVAHGN